MRLYRGRRAFFVSVIRIDTTRATPPAAAVKNTGRRGSISYTVSKRALPRIEAKRPAL